MDLRFKISALGIGPHISLSLVKKNLWMNYMSIMSKKRYLKDCSIFIEKTINGNLLVAKIMNA